MRPITAAVALALAVALSPARAGGQDADPARAYLPASAGVRELTRGQLVIKVLIDAAVLGGDELEMVEITFPAGAGARGGEHTHGRVEVLYLLEGEMDHVVNGVAHHLSPGMVGIVRPGDRVVHRVTSSSPVRALVMWTPGGELARIEPR